MEEGGGAASGKESSQLSVRVAVYWLLQQGKHLLASDAIVEVTVYLA